MFEHDFLEFTHFFEEGEINNCNFHYQFNII